MTTKTLIIAINHTDQCTFVRSEELSGSYGSNYQVVDSIEDGINTALSGEFDRIYVSPVFEIGFRKSWILSVTDSTLKKLADAGVDSAKHDTRDAIEIITTHLHPPPLIIPQRFKLDCDHKVLNDLFDSFERALPTTQSGRITPQLKQPFQELKQAVTSYRKDASTDKLQQSLSSMIDSLKPFFGEKLEKSAIVSGCINNLQAAVNVALRLEQGEFLPQNGFELAREIAESSRGLPITKTHLRC